MTTQEPYVPTHPDLFIVKFQTGDFASSLVSLKSFKAEEIITDLAPFTRVPHATYATVRCGPAPEDHIELKSDLVYVNHSCEPNVVFDLSSKDVLQWHLRAVRLIKPGDPLTYFYPSTEWKMAQPFDCLCGSMNCLGRIEGAVSLTTAELSSRGFINPWILAQSKTKRQHRLSGLLPQHLTYTDHSTRLTMPPVPQSLRSSVRCTRRGPHVVPLTFSRSASHGAPHYNEPTGFLFGEKPPAPGQKRRREEWELIWYVGMFGTFAAATVAVYYKPDTSIQSWALVEAKKRMEARGEATDYVPKP